MGLSQIIIGPHIYHGTNNLIYCTEWESELKGRELKLTTLDRSLFESSNSGAWWVLVCVWGFSNIGCWLFCWGSHHSLEQGDGSDLLVQLSLRAPHPQSQQVFWLLARIRKGQQLESNGEKFGLGLIKRKIEIFTSGGGDGIKAQYFLLPLWQHIIDQLSCFMSYGDFYFIVPGNCTLTICWPAMINFYLLCWQNYSDALWVRCWYWCMFWLCTFDCPIHMDTFTMWILRL